MDPTLFQSLGRDSGCSSDSGWRGDVSSARVSIPRSGFWVFKRRRRWPPRRRPASFNPSVGILGVQAWLAIKASSGNVEFQSLGRDSGCSSEVTPDVLDQLVQVSIPRSGFWVFKLDLDKQPQGGDDLVSIPRSGFWVFKPACAIGVEPRFELFQSLGRDSGCSSLDGLPRSTANLSVSIPRSGFWVFKQRRRMIQDEQKARFNPSVGILGVQAKSGHMRRYRY